LRIKQFKQKEKDKKLLDKWLIPWLWLNEQLKDSLTNVEENNSYDLGMQPLSRKYMIVFTITFKQVYELTH
jgi:hypothetical protein